MPMFGMTGKRIETLKEQELLFVLFKLFVEGGHFCVYPELLTRIFLFLPFVTPRPPEVCSMILRSKIPTAEYFYKKGIVYAILSYGTTFDSYTRIWVNRT
jgi:hypothetical protein